MQHVSSPFPHGCNPPTIGDSTSTTTSFCAHYSSTWSSAFSTSLLRLQCTSSNPSSLDFKAVDPSRLHYYGYYLRLQFALTTLSWTTLRLVKLSLLIFFWRLFDSVRTHARLFWWIMCGITVATYIVSMFLQGFNCLPLGSFFTFGKLQTTAACHRYATIDETLPGGCSSRDNVHRTIVIFHFSSIADIIMDFFSE